MPSRRILGTANSVKPMKPMKRSRVWFLSATFLVATVVLLSAISKRTMLVEATAYNSVAPQTNAKPWIGAWGDRLEPDTKAIAVSRDLLEEGLVRGVEVEIEGRPGKYRVLDKMGSRWERRIDIYMGEDIEAAREWGLRAVRIHW
jgi:3D (Asp-Asp-Asp) domain-containing protein